MWTYAWPCIALVYLALAGLSLHQIAYLDKPGGRPTSARNRVPRLYTHVMVRLIQWRSEVQLSLNVFQSYSSKNVIPYSAFVCPILLTKLALFYDTEPKRKPGRALAQPCLEGSRWSADQREPSNHGYGVMATVASWLWNPGCGILTV